MAGQESTSDDTSSGLVAGAWFLVAGGVLLLISGVLFWFSLLRETHDFWLNSGGYPILLRDTVLVTYYPLLVVTFPGLLGLTITTCSKIRMPAGFGCFQIMVLLGCWFPVCGSLVIAFGNNVANRWSGRPLHYKAPSFRR